MENLEIFKDAIFCEKDVLPAMEACYKDLLDNYSPNTANIFINLLEMVENIDDRIEEIFKVIDFIRFPVGKAIHTPST